MWGGSKLDSRVKKEIIVVAMVVLLMVETFFLLGALDQRHVIASGPETLMPRCLEIKKERKPSARVCV